MGLINLTTNLKGLGFGDDRYKRGNSNEPYIQTQIPATNEPLQTEFSLSGNNIIENLGGIAVAATTGFLLSGFNPLGAAVGLGVGVAGAVATNDFQVGFKAPSAGTGGPDFLLRGGTLLPNRIANDVERISKLIIDTKSAKGFLFTTKQNLLSRVAVKTEGTQEALLNDGVYLPTSTLASVAGIALGGYFNKQGANPFSGIGQSFVPDKYYTTVKQQFIDNIYTTNRLWGLYNAKILQSSLYPLQLNENQKQLGISELTTDILSYRGGPGAVLGIGNTNIKFADQRTGINNPAFKKQLKEGELRNYTSYQSGVKYSPRGDKSEKLDTLSNTITTIGNHYFARNFHIQKPLSKVGTFGERKTNIDGLPQQNYSTIADNTGDRPADLIDFYFTIINNNSLNNNTYLYFPAYIDSFGDSYSADWKSEKFLGRGENFYLYGGFNRDISLDFSIYVSNANDMQMYMISLNALASCLTPDYSSNGFMRGVINKLTMGRYLEDVPGIITSLKYDLPLESPWDVVTPIIGGDGQPVQLPMYIKVSLGFKPIHNFAPSKQTPYFISPSLTTTNATITTLNSADISSIRPVNQPPSPPPPPSPSEIDNKIQQSPLYTDGEKYKILNSGFSESEKQLVYDLRHGTLVAESDNISGVPLTP